jgi:hypothetical protein
MKEAKSFSVPQSRRWSLSEARDVIEALERSGEPVTEKSLPVKVFPGPSGPGLPHATRPERLSVHRRGVSIAIVL